MKKHQRIKSVKPTVNLAAWIKAYAVDDEAASEAIRRSEGRQRGDDQAAKEKGRHRLR